MNRYYITYDYKIENNIIKYEEFKIYENIKNEKKLIAKDNKLSNLFYVKDLLNNLTSNIK